MPWWLGGTVRASSRPETLEETKDTSSHRNAWDRGEGWLMLRGVRHPPCEIRKLGGCEDLPSSWDWERFRPVAVRGLQPCDSSRAEFRSRQLQLRRCCGPAPPWRCGNSPSIGARMSPSICDVTSNIPGAMPAGPLAPGTMSTSATCA